MAGDAGKSAGQNRLTDYGVTITASQTTTGANLTINWEAPDGHPSNDYLRLAKVGDPDNSYSWTQTIGTAGSGNFSVTIPNTVARYEFRLYRGSDNQRVAQSASFVANKTDYSVTASPLTVPAGGQVTVDWSSPPNSPVIDRLAITSANSSTVISQQYTGGINPKTVRLTVPTDPGQYEVRYLETGASQPSALSQIVTVESAAGSFAGTVQKGETGEHISGALVEAMQNSVVKGTAATNSNGAYELPLNLTGTYDLKVTAPNLPAVTKTGHVLSSGATTIVDFSVYGTGSLNGKITNSGNGVAISGATIQIKQGETQIAAATTDASGNYAVQQLPPGTYSADIAANGFTPSTQSNIVITAGATTVLNAGLSVTSGTPSSLEYIYDDGGRIVATKESGVVKNIYTYDLSGNLLSITVPQANTPYIISFSPRTGLPGTQVVIRGLGFGTTSGQNAVSFNGTSAVISSFSATEIVTSVPSGATTGTISVTTPNGTVVTGQPFVVETDAGETLPTISGISPLVGHAGDTVTVTGTNFESELSDNSVKFGASGAGIISGTTTSLQVRANTSSGKVSVTTPGGTAVSQQEFVSVPASIDPAKVSYYGRTWFGRMNTINIASDTVGVVTLDGVAGKRFSIKPIITSNVKVEVIRPDGRVLSTNNLSTLGTPRSWFIDTQTFPLTGTYTVIITPVNPSVPTLVRMTVYDVPPDVTGVMPFNTTRLVNITTPGQNGRLTYNATAGQKILLKVTESTMTGYISSRQEVISTSVPRPPITGVEYRELSSFYTADGTTIPASGTYTIDIDPSGPDTGPMTVSLYLVPPDQVHSIDIGTTTNVTTTSPGQNVWLAFYGTQGQRISLQTRNSTFAGGFEMSLNKPDGTFFVPPRRMFSNSFIDTLTLPVSGYYKIYINPDGEFTGGVLVDLFNVPNDIVGSTTINGPAVTAAAIVPGQNPTITFDALQGQQARVNVTSSTYTGTTQFKLKKPDGSIMWYGTISSGSGTISSTTLPVAGTYSVEIDPWEANLGSASVSVGGDVYGTVTPGGSSVTTTINNAGQNSWLSFTGTAGQRVSLKVTSTTINTGSVSFRKPDGSILGTELQLGTNNNFLDTVTLPTNGTYYVVVAPAGTHTGSATMTLYDVPSDSAGTISIGGNSQTKTTTVPGQNLLLTFSGTSNQKFTLDASGGTFPNSAQIVVRKPDGSTLTGGGTSSGALTMTDIVLPESGTFSIFVNPVNDDIGSVTLQLYGTGTGSNPTVQLSQSVSVLKGLVSPSNSDISASVSVRKGAVSTGSADGEVFNSVSVSTGPVISSLSPVQYAKGNTFTLTITGNNLTGASALRFYNANGDLETGITVTNINVNSGGTVLTATVQIGSGVAAGERVVVIETPSFGISPRMNVTLNVFNVTQ